MEKAKIISKPRIEQEPIPIDEAVAIIGSKLPDTVAIVSKEYSAKVWAHIENGEFNKKNKKQLAKAYQSMVSAVCANQITEVGRFEPVVDFSMLDDVHVFDGTRKGVETCTACHGLGGLIKFYKKPKEVQCLKCKTVSFSMDGKVIHIDDKILLVDGVDRSDDPNYKWLFGRVIEPCNSCGATGRYRDTSKAEGLVINVKCRTCKGRHYTTDLQGTQVITKCKTCRGKQRVKIPMLIGKVKSITPCNICSGMGFVKPKAGPDNPVISADLAKKIKQL